MMQTDTTQRFLFANTDIRGERVQLSNSLQEALAPHAYPPVVKALLGELSAAAVLLSTTLKFQGQMTLQARSPGPLSLLMVECTDQRTFRCVAQWDDQQLSPATTSLGKLLPGGHLVITIDPTQGRRYQGIVALEGITLAECFDNYFAQSEQLPTRFWLTCDGEQAGGFLLQSLPAGNNSTQSDTVARAQQWEHITVLAETLKGSELLNLPTEQLLYRLYHQDDIRLFEGEQVRYRCSCSRERTGTALTTMTPADIQELLADQGKIDMDCQFCNTRYTFTETDIAELLGSKATHH